jgi:hypothetical protein
VVPGVSSCVLAVKPSESKGGVGDCYDNTIPPTTTDCYRLYQTNGTRNDTRGPYEQTDQVQYCTDKRESSRPTLYATTHRPYPKRIVVSGYNKTRKAVVGYEERQQRLRAAREPYRAIDTGTSGAALNDLVVSYGLLRQPAKGCGVD